MFKITVFRTPQCYRLLAKFRRYEHFVSPEGDNLPAITLTYNIGTDTGINNVTVDTKQADAIYTLSGVRVSGKLPAGVYIKNGKKVIVK